MRLPGGGEVSPGRGTCADICHRNHRQRLVAVLKPAAAVGVEGQDVRAAATAAGGSDREVEAAVGDRPQVGVARHQVRVVDDVIGDVTTAASADGRRRPQQVGRKDSRHLQRRSKVKLKQVKVAHTRLPSAGFGS